jgi:hypothetical protein
MEGENEGNDQWPRLCPFQLGFSAFCLSRIYKGEIKARDI